VAPISKKIDKDDYLAEQTSNFNKFLWLHFLMKSDPIYGTELIIIVFEGIRIFKTPLELF